MMEEDNSFRIITEKLTDNLRLSGSPRSKLVESILVLLLSKPLRTSEIANNLGYDTKYISSYLSYWKKKGLVYQEGGRWYLTAAGENLAREILDSFTNSRFKEMLGIAKQILSEHVKQSKNNKRIEKEGKSEKEVLLFFDLKTSNDFKKQQKKDPEDCVKDILNKLDDDEREVVELLISRYKQWNSTYMYIDQLQEELRNADMGWLFRVLRNLQTKKIIYLYQDPKLGLRVGFSQQFKVLLNC
ncbi:MAG: replication initiator protein WhiP [Sulfolobaceae archaeon]